MLRRLSLMSAFLSLSLCIGVVLMTLPPARTAQRTSADSIRHTSVLPEASGQMTAQRFAHAGEPAAALDNLTQDDLVAAATQWNEAYPALDAFWRDAFAQARLRYATPRILVMTSDVVQTGCGTVRRHGPLYCPADHTIYFDPVFVAGEMKRVGERLGTDGDMAAITMLAHEWGHAVQRMIGVSNSNSRTNEMQADCMAGGFARYGLEKGYLEQGDVEEAQMALAIAGAVHGTHPNPQQRVNSFMLGFERGGGACWSF